MLVLERVFNESRLPSFTPQILWLLVYEVGLPRWKNPPANAGDAGDVGSIPGSGRSPGEGNGNHSSILTLEIPWTEEPGGL